MSADNLPPEGHDPEPDRTPGGGHPGAADTTGARDADPGPDASTSPGDARPSSVDPAEVEGTLDGIEATLDRVEAAIARVDEGTYGTCATCGRPIGRERLEAVPTATTCAEDAEPAAPQASASGNDSASGDDNGNAGGNGSASA